MKTRIFAVISAAVLALSAFSVVSAQDAEKKAQKWIDDGANKTVFASIDSEDEDEAEIADFSADAAALAHLAAQFSKDKLVGGFDLVASEDLDEAVTVVVADDAIAANKKYALRNFNTSTGEYTTAALVSVKAGVAKFKVTKVGPYALVEVKASDNATQVAEVKIEVVKNDKKVSPKTGEV